MGSAAGALRTLAIFDKPDPQPDLIARIRRLGIEPAEFGVAITSRKILDAAGRLVCERECPQVLAAWEDLPALGDRGRGRSRCVPCIR